MKNFNRTKKILLATLCTVSTLNFPSLTADAKEYRSHTDTNTTIFDYIENRRRQRRQNALTEDQQKLLADIEEAKERLPGAIQEGERVPVAFEGDDMVYNAVTGEFVATGSVDIIQLDGRRFQSNEAHGNLKTQDVVVDGKAHMLQITQDAPRITLDGYNAVYNYGSGIGTMDSAKGKAGEYYVSGKRFEFYPDHVVIHDGSQTRCSAKNPDYSLTAERIEIFPNQIMRMYNVKFLIRGTVVGKKSYTERRLDSDDDFYFPRIGYNSDDGVYVEDTFAFPLLTNVEGILHPYIDSEHGIRSSAEILFNYGNFAATGMYGYYRDGNSNWLRKIPSLNLHYSGKIENLPLNYGVTYEVGKWKNNSVESLHQEIEFALGHDPIIFPGNFYLLLTTSYKITDENVRTEGIGDSRVRGWNYSATFAKEFDEKFAAFLRYEYTKNNSQNSLFDFDLDSFSKKFLTGASYQLTDKDRFVVGLKFDADSGKLEDADYYWYRDLHCSTAILRWRDKRNKFEVHWQFTPW